MHGFRLQKNLLENIYKFYRKILNKASCYIVKYRKITSHFVIIRTGKTLLTKLFAILKQCRVSFLPFPLLAISAAFLMASNQSLTSLLYTSLSFTFLHIFMCSMNHTYDVKYDAASVIMKQLNPIVTKELTLAEAKIINIFSATLAILTSVFVGTYWLYLIIIGLLLVIVYDLEPVRLKDRTVGLFIPPFASSLPFLFGYLTATQSTIVPLQIIVVFIFFYLLGVTSIRHIPDYEMDIQMNVHNFTSTYGITATKYLEMLVGILALCIFMLGIYLNILSIIGLPILLLTTLFKANLLIRSRIGVLQLPKTWTRFAQILVINSIALVLSVIPINIALF